MSGEAGRRTKRVWLAWAALVGLLALTTFLAYLPLGRGSLPVSLAIAAAKAGIILAIFMELTSASGLTVVFAAAGFFWLAILLGLPQTDYLVRTAKSTGEHQTPERQGAGEPRRQSPR